MKISPLVTSSISRAVVLTLFTEIVNRFDRNKSNVDSVKKNSDKVSTLVTGAGLLSPVLKNKKLLLYGSAAIVVAGLVAGLLKHSSAFEKSRSL